MEPSRNRRVGMRTVVSVVVAIALVLAALVVLLLLLTGAIGATEEFDPGTPVRVPHPGG